MVDELSKKREMLKFCRGLFEIGNLVGTDFDDMQIFEVKGRNFPMQLDGAGLHVTFSVSWQAISKTKEEARKAIGILLPDLSEEESE